MNKQHLANEVAAVLMLPQLQNQGKAYEIVKAIVKVITDALDRGEQVYVKGLGRFFIRQRAALRIGSFWGSSSFSDPNTIRIVHTIPAKKYVHFQPSPNLLKVLNANI